MAGETKRKGGRGRWLVGISLFFVVLVLGFTVWPRHDHLESLRVLYPEETVSYPRTDLNYPPGFKLNVEHVFHFSQDCTTVKRVFEPELRLHGSVYPTPLYRVFKPIIATDPNGPCNGTIYLPYEPSWYGMAGQWLEDKFPSLKRQKPDPNSHRIGM
jgi:hypothetical protein